MKDINEKLGTETLSANLFDMEGFPDQSQINKVLNRIDINAPAAHFLDKLFEEMYSRVPLSEGDSDNIIVILYMKDFVKEAQKNGFENVTIYYLK